MPDVYEQPKSTVRVHAVSPERDGCEIRFPRVTGYRVELPDDQSDAHFSTIVEAERGAGGIVTAVLDPLVPEVRGFRRGDAEDKASTMRTYWIPGVNRLDSYGRWQFVEFRNDWEFKADLETAIVQARRSAAARQSGNRALDDRETVLAALRRHKSEMSEEFGVRSLKLFGSFARDQAQLTSDVDIMVEFGGKPDWGNYTRASAFLEDLPGRSVDMTMHRHLREYVRPNAERDAIDV